MLCAPFKAFDGKRFLSVVTESLRQFFFARVVGGAAADWVVGLTAGTLVSECGGF